MPRIEDIERFKAKLNSLGNEPAILASRGEKLYDVSPSESELSQDLQTLLEDEEQPAAGEDAAPSVSDLEDLLGETEEVEGLPEDVPSEGADLGLDELLGEAEPPDLEDLLGGPEAPEEAPDLDDLLGDAETPDEVSDFDDLLSDAETPEEVPDLDDLLGGDETFEEASVSEEEAAEDVTDLDAFLESFDELAAEPSEDAEVPPPETDFFGASELLEEEPTAPVAGEEPVEVPGSDEGEPFEVSEPEEAEAFEMPAFEGDESLDGLEMSGFEEDESYEGVSPEDAFEMPGLEEDESFETLEMPGTEAEEASEAFETFEEPPIEAGDLEFEDFGSSDALEPEDLIEPSVEMEEESVELPDLEEEPPSGQSQEEESLEGPALDLSGVSDAPIDMSDIDSLLGELGTSEESGEEAEFDLGESEEFAEPESFEEISPEAAAEPEEDFGDFEFEEPAAAEAESGEEEAQDLFEGFGEPGVDEAESAEFEDFGDFEDLGSEEGEDSGSAAGEEEEFAFEDFGAEPSFGEFGEPEEPVDLSLGESAGLELGEDLGGGPDEAFAASEEAPGDLEFGADLGEFGGGDEEFSDEELALEETDSFAMPAGMGFDTGDEEFALDDFQLGDLGEQFSDLGEEAPSAEELNPAAALGPAPAETEVFRLSNGDFAKLQENLDKQPRNLRLAIARLVGVDEITGKNLRNLVNALVRGAPPKELAELVRRITGTRIEIPTRFERLTAEDFEARTSSFGYIFVNTFLPLLRVVAVFALALGVTAFLGYRFVYRPIYAATLYNRGYEEIQADRYYQGNDLFDRAVAQWEIKKEYFRFAQAFTDKDQLGLARDKYLQLIDRYPDDHDAHLDYGKFESEMMADYETAKEQFDFLLNQDRYMYDPDVLLAAGDNYMAWGAEDPSMYEEARFNYATLAQVEGYTDQVEFRMLRYFLRMTEEGIDDKHDEIERLRHRFENEKNADIEADVYSELAEYYIKRGELDGVQDMLLRAQEAAPHLPEVHFRLALYFNAVGDRAKERDALINTGYYLEQAGVRTRARAAMEIEALTMLGRNYYDAQEYLDAGDTLARAANLYQDSLSRLLVEPEAKFGKIYSYLGDLDYFVSGDLSQARRNFDRAEDNGYWTENLSYKRGFIEYEAGDNSGAARDFYRASMTKPANKVLLFARANNLYREESYATARGFYETLLGLLQTERDGIRDLRVNDNPSHREIMENLLVVHNNLGVTLEKLDEQSPDRDRSAEALAHLEESTRIFDTLSRDPATLVRADTVNLGFLNIRAIITPLADHGLAIYGRIPRELDATALGQ